MSDSIPEDDQNLVGRLEDAADAAAPEHPEALLLEAKLEIKRLRALVVQYEARAATAMGTLEAPPESTEPPFRIEHDVPGNAPV
jgi:hypothetical protein